MKKSLIALATLGAFAGAASAQSSVTLFGIVDANLRYVKNDKVRETGTYRNGHRTGRWKRYDINGKLEMEWEE